MSKTKPTTTDDHTPATPEGPETPANEPETGPETPETERQTTPAGEDVPPADDPAGQLADVIAERDELRRQVDRLTVAADTGVPVALLTAGSVEELRQQADAIAAYAHTRGPIDFGAGKRGEDGAPGTDPDPDPLRTALASRRRR